MTSIIRIEYVRPRRGGEAYGISENVFRRMGRDNFGVVVPAETLQVGAVSVQSAIAPVFETDMSLQGGVFARVVCLSGAVVISPPTSDAVSPVATQATGVRLAAGDEPLLFPIETGWRLAAIESTWLSRLTGRIPLLSNAAASGAAISGVPAGSYIFSAQGTFGGAQLILRVLGPDGVNYLDLESLTAPGRKGVVLGERDTVRAFLVGGVPAGIYAELS